ncbi:MAG: efflux RND transporter periplasmic adaptor subunit [Candidatus Saganbacteria bacterium]|nr:efflux RND transporter periplasmic adaptor subunit [Candidatus Saganbacteria bacterium]
MKLKNILIGILVVIVLLSAYRIMNTISKKKVQEDRVYSVVVAKPEIGTIQEKITLVGDVKGEAEVAVRPRTVGRVEEIYVKEGDQVWEGQRLMSFVKGITRKNDLYDDVVTSAPISGVVGMQNYKVGEQVQMVNGSPAVVFTVYKINNIKIYANVPEKYYSFLKKNTKVEVTFDPIPSKVFNGTVNNIRPVIDPYTRTTQIEIVLKNRCSAWTK